MQNLILTRCAANEELHLRSSCAVTESDGTGECDEITRSDTVPRDEGLLQLDDFVKTDVGVECGLDLVEDHNRPVRSTATVS